MYKIKYKISTFVLYLFIISVFLITQNSQILSEQKIEIINNMNYGNYKNISIKINSTYYIDSLKISGNNISDLVKLDKKSKKVIVEYLLNENDSENIEITLFYDGKNKTFIKKVY